MSRTRVIFALLAVACLIAASASASVISGSTTPTVKSHATGQRAETINAADYQKELNTHFEQVVRREADLRTRETGSLYTDSGEWGGFVRALGNDQGGYYLGRGGGHAYGRDGLFQSNGHAYGKHKDKKTKNKEGGDDPAIGGGGVEPAPEPATWVLILSALVAGGFYLASARLRQIG